MSRREEWRKVLDAETERWSEKSCEQLITELREVRCYEVEVDSKHFQVEVQLLENTNEYVHVSVDVDDGSLPWSIFPVSQTFIRQKDKSG
ncbi:MAG: hypothetical protein ABSG60_17095 [Terracidiphilus sp.]|jgi:hypothetical protein